MNYREAKIEQIARYLNISMLFAEGLKNNHHSFVRIARIKQ